MTFVFTYAGTLSLSQEMDVKAIEEMAIGDVLIKGGSPGHAVIVVDMAVEETSGDKYYILAQSYMPAQEIQILAAPRSDVSPWYKLTNTDTIVTPEWRFTSDQLKAFSD